MSGGCSGRLPAYATATERLAPMRVRGRRPRPFLGNWALCLDQPGFVPRQSYDRTMRVRPARVERLPEQYFGALLTRVSAAAAARSEPVIDLGRGNPETGPLPYVVEALTTAARRTDVH